MTPEDVQATHGRSVEETALAYSPRVGVPAVELARELLELMRTRYASGVPLLPGALELVDALAAVMPVAIASNTDPGLVRSVLATLGIEEAFGAVASGAVVRPKPWPDPYLAACAALGVDSADAIGFEDSPVGIRAAKAAGLFAVGVPDRPGPGLVEAGADLVVGSLLELVPLV